MTLETKDLQKLTGRFENEFNFVLVVVTGFHGYLVVVGCAFQDFGKVDEIHAKDHVAVAAESGEAVAVQVDGDQRHMRGVHGLQ